MEQKNSESIEEILLSRGIIGLTDLKKAMAIQAKTQQNIEDILLELDLVSSKGLLLANSIKFGIDFIDSNEFLLLDKSIIRLVPKILVEKHCLFPIKEENGTLIVAMKDPKNMTAIDELKVSTGFEIVPKLADEKMILELIMEYYNVSFKKKNLVDLFLMLYLFAFYSFTIFLISGFVSKIVSDAMKINLEIPFGWLTFFIAIGSTLKASFVIKSLSGFINNPEFIEGEIIDCRIISGDGDSQHDSKEYTIRYTDPINREIKCFKFRGELGATCSLRYYNGKVAINCWSGVWKEFIYYFPVSFAAWFVFWLIIVDILKLTK